MKQMAEDNVILIYNKKCKSIYKLKLKFYCYPLNQKEFKKLKKIKIENWMQLKNSLSIYLLEFLLIFYKKKIKE